LSGFGPFWFGCPCVLVTMFHRTYTRHYVPRTCTRIITLLRAKALRTHFVLFARVAFALLMYTMFHRTYTRHYVPRTCTRIIVRIVFLVSSLRSLSRLLVLTLALTCSTLSCMIRCTHLHSSVCLA
jgi:hypothetical protein